VIFILFLMIAFQSARTSVGPVPNYIATHTTTATPTDQTVRILSQQVEELTERQATLSEEVSNFEFSIAKVLELLFASVQYLAWPFLIGVAAWYFHPQIGIFLSHIAERARTDHIKLGNAELTRVEVRTGLAERERLRVGLRIAGADGIYEHKELREIVKQADLMTVQGDQLTDEEKRQIFEAAIQVAFVDEELDDTEYDVILEEAKQGYKMSDTDIVKLNNRIKKLASGQNVKLPQRLST